ncbi:MAG: hypothetical protein DMG32_26805 [Acidobacteria bacterium]|nr:MAG: hypothetical protein DMG32_26805 [Acidobacteriota bacterium]
MHGRLKRNKIRMRASFWENALLVLIGVFAFVLAGSLDERGIPQRWGTAIVGTLLTFGLVIFACRPRLLRWSFWAALAICLAVHVLAIWAFFEYVLKNFKRFSILLWLPVMLTEVVVLLIVVNRVEKKLSGKHETIELRF